MNGTNSSTNAIHDSISSDKLGLRQGWTSGPDTRGTMDIIWNCTLTTFLCAWSILVVNVPEPGSRFLSIFKRKLLLVLLYAIAPELIFQLALGQWLSARRSVKLFHESGYTDWTVRHGFYADMGALHLESPHWKSFPVNAEQLHYLVKKGYVQYPKISDDHIRDKNKMDGMLRTITLIQTMWFTINIIFRAAQQLAITVFELSTTAFVLLSVATSICWMLKPADVQSPDFIRTETEIAQILQDGGDAAEGVYNRTPLDFIGRHEWSWSVVWAHGLEYLRKWNMAAQPLQRPVARFQNTVVPAIEGWSFWVFTAISVAYFAIFIAGWNFDFPTKTESLLWKTASLLAMLTALAVGGALHIYWSRSQKLHHKCRQIFRRRSDEENDASQQSHPYPPRGHRKTVSRIVAYLKNNSLVKDPALETPVEVVILTWIFGIFYCAARIYIIVADFVELRSLPRSAYQDVNWSSYWPHV